MQTAAPLTRSIDRLSWSSQGTRALGQSDHHVSPAPIGTPEHECHLATSFRNLQLPYAFIRLWPSCHFDLGGNEVWLKVVHRTHRSLKLMPKLQKALKVAWEWAGTTSYVNIPVYTEVTKGRQSTWSYANRKYASVNHKNNCLSRTACVMGVSWTTFQGSLCIKKFLPAT